MRLFIRTDDVHRPLVWTTSRELYFTSIRWWQCLWSTRAQVVIWGQHLIEPWRLFRLDFLFCSRHSAVFTLWLGNIMAWLDWTFWSVWSQMEMLRLPVKNSWFWSLQKTYKTLQKLSVTSKKLTIHVDCWRCSLSTRSHAAGKQDG